MCILKFDSDYHLTVIDPDFVIAAVISITRTFISSFDVLMYLRIGWT